MRPESEALMFTLCDVPALRVLLAGLMPSHPEPLAVDADHEPSEPQLVNVTVCAAGAPCPCVPVNESDPGLARIQGGGDGGGCTVNVIDTVCRAVPELVVRAKAIVSV